MNKRKKIRTRLVSLAACLCILTGLLWGIPVSAAESNDFTLPTYTLKVQGENYALDAEVTGKMHLNTEYTVEIGQYNTEYFEGLTIDYVYPTIEGYGVPGEGYDFVSEFNIHMPMTLTDANGETVTEATMTADVTLPIPDGYVGEGAFARTDNGTKLADGVLDGEGVTFKGLPVKFENGYLDSGIALVEWKKDSGGDTNPGGGNTGDDTNPGGDTNSAGDTNPSGNTATGGDTNSGGNTNPGSDTTSGAVTSPQTGNNSNLAFWFALLFICGSAAIGTAVVSRKKKYNR